MRRHTVTLLTALALISTASVTIGTLGGCTSRRPLPTVRNDADHAFSIRQWAKAETDYQEYLNRKPESNDVRFLLAQSQLEQGKTREANWNFGIALDVDPLNDSILDRSAESLYQSGNREALTAFLLRAASERGRVSDYMRLGKYMQQIGHPDEAVQAYMTAAKIDEGKTPAVQLALADLYKDLGDRPQATRRLRMAYFLSPEDPKILQRIRDLGEIPGPTFALAPVEMGQMVIVPDTSK
ncbi:MAG: hypothetical protein U0640_04545 [Phycisphaerales bacterium]